MLSYYKYFYTLLYHFVYFHTLSTFLYGEELKQAEGKMNILAKMLSKEPNQEHTNNFFRKDYNAERSSKTKESTNFDSQQVGRPNSLELLGGSVTNKAKEDKLITNKITSGARHPF